MNKIADRIKEIIEITNHNPFSFANKIGVSSTVIYNMIGGRKSSPGADILEKMKAAFPEIDMNWLIAGIGNPLTNGENNSEISIKLTDLTNRMQQIQKLAEVMGRHNTVLKSNVNRLKKMKSKRSRGKSKL